MKRLFTLTLALGAAVCVGCGQADTGTPTAAVPAESAAQATSAGAGSTPGNAEISTPAETVTMFLDRVRRGGETSSAGALLTQRAQSELARIGRSVQPIGTPDAKFAVTRTKAIPGEENSVLVHSLWTEPLGNGQESQYQVVWAVQREEAGWRISGLAMELESGTDPMVVDFENGARMATLFADPSENETIQSDKTSQAQAPAATLNR